RALIFLSVLFVHHVPRPSTCAKRDRSSSRWPRAAHPRLDSLPAPPRGAASPASNLSRDRIYIGMRSTGSDKYQLAGHRHGAQPIDVVVRLLTGGRGVGGFGGRG